MTVTDKKINIFSQNFSLKLYEKTDFNSNLALKEILIWYNKLYLCIVCFLPDWRSNMPNYEKNSQKSDFVDISSNKQVKKLYNKKGRLKRILCLVFSIIFLLGGGGMLYYYSFLDTLNFKELDDTTTTTQQLPTHRLHRLRATQQIFRFQRVNFCRTQKSLMLCSLAKIIQTAINTAEVIQ